MDSPNTSRLLVRTSARGHLLVYQGEPGVCTIVTVENYEKWYGLHLVRSGKPVEEIPFPDESLETGVPHVDHVPNPRAVLRMAQRFGFVIDPQSYEMMVGRWEMEVLGTYQVSPGCWPAIEPKPAPARSSHEPWCDNRFGGGCSCGYTAG